MSDKCIEVGAWGCTAFCGWTQELTNGCSYNGGLYTCTPGTRTSSAVLCCSLKVIPHEVRGRSLRQDGQMWCVDCPLTHDLGNTGPGHHDSKALFFPLGMERLSDLGSPSDLLLLVKLHLF